MSARRVAILLIAALVAGIAHARAQNVGPADREITRLQGDLYRVREGREHTVFLVTSAGIVLGDPLSAETAIWLEDELEVRFPGRPIRFVILSSHRHTRATGGRVLADSAELIGHKAFSNAVNRARRASPDLYARVSDVERRYKTRERISLGGQVVEVVHVGSAHAPENSLLFFPSERIAFGIDIPPLTLERGFGDFRPRDVMTWARTVDALDFDTLITADGRRVTHLEVTALNRYLSTLFDTVAEDYDAGRSPTQAVASPKLEPYRATPFFTGRQAQIAAAYGDIRLRTVELYGLALGTYTAPAPCPDSATCSSAEVVPGVTAGVRTSVRRLGLAGEMTFGLQRSTTRSTRFVTQDLVFRDTRVSVLTRFASAPGSFSLAALGGMSYTVTDADGMSTTGGAVPPLGGRRPLESRQTRWGITGGADIATRVGADVSIVVPIRVTRYLGSGGSLLIPQDPYDVQAGLGLSIRVLKRLRY